MREPISKFAEATCDFLFERRTYAPSSVFAEPKIVAHRGAWDLSARRENTLAALNEAARLGMDAIEFDVRFTHDNVPVVLHDPSLLRVFKIPNLIGELSLVGLRALNIDVPLLTDVLAIPDVHFMIEIKTPMNPRQVAVLRETLSGLTPIQDFHFLVLDENLVRPEFPAATWILVGDLRLKGLVESSIRRRLGGVAGHYLTMTDQFIARLHEHEQSVSTGFVSSRNILNREWARGIDWVFTNVARQLRK